jgi:hypothetical protein
MRWMPLVALAILLGCLSASGQQFDREKEFKLLSSRDQRWVTSITEKIKEGKGISRKEHEFIVAHFDFFNTKELRAIIAQGVWEKSTGGIILKNLGWEESDEGAESLAVKFFLLVGDEVKARPLKFLSERIAEAGIDGLSRDEKKMVSENRWLFLAPQPTPEERAKGELGRLSKDELAAMSKIATALEKGDYKWLDQADLAVMRKCPNVCRTGDVPGWLVKWAKASGVEEFLKNLRIDQRQDAEKLMAYFAMLPPMTNAAGERLEGKQAALEISRKAKKRGMAALSEQERKYVKQHKQLFLAKPPKK